MIKEYFVFFMGLFLGMLLIYFLLKKQQKETISYGVSSFVEKQHSEKQSRKEKILSVLKEKGDIRNKEVEELLGVSDATATNYLQELEREDLIEQVRKRGRFVFYRLKIN